MRKKSVSLLEILIVMIIVGVLATLGMVNYSLQRERAPVKEGGYQI